MCEERVIESLRTIVIRADGGGNAGLGHVVRCVSIAEVWLRRGGYVVFATSTEILPVLNLPAERAVVEPAEVTRTAERDAEAIADLASANHASLVVVDGYRFKSDYRRVLKSRGLRVIAVDDNGEAGSADADYIVNHNLHAREEMYAGRAAETKLLLGPRYALLRSEFGHAARRETAPLVKRVLVTLGGGAPSSVLKRVLDGIYEANVRIAAIRVVIGPPGGAAEALLNGRRPGEVEIVRSPQSMAPLMAWADVAISGAGVTTLESACMGLPALVTVMADNQERLSQALASAGIVVSLGPANRLTSADVARELAALCVDSHRRVKMSVAGQALVDGRGADRVVDAVLAGERAR